MTGDDARRWVANWRIVNERQEQERASQTYQHRLGALATLMASADLFPSARTEEENAAVRERWIRLKALAGRR